MSRLSLKLLLAFFFIALSVILNSKYTDADRIKIGYIVKRPSERWFKYELVGAQKAAAELDADLYVIGGRDNEQTLNVVNSLIGDGVDGIIICSPDAKLGNAIQRLTNSFGVRLFSVDDQLQNTDGTYIADIPHLGISEVKVAAEISNYLLGEMINRGWDFKNTALLTLSNKSLKTSEFRVEEVAKRILSQGCRESNIFMAEQADIDQRDAYRATAEVINKNYQIKNWLVCGFNDQSAIGAAHALESIGIDATRAIVVGVNGLDATRVFFKGEKNALAASVLLNPYKHGYSSVSMMYDWIKNDVKPALLTLTEGVIVDRFNYQEQIDNLYRKQERATYLKGDQ